jgi:SSS family solute:Na+ symporter
MSIAAGADKNPAFAGFFKAYGANFAVPALFLQEFPAWFAGFAFAAIGIGALVPAAIMSIAAANLYTRNIHREFLRPNCTLAEEAQIAKIVSLVVKFGALLFIIFLPQQYAIQLQLLGGIWIIQTLPAVIVGLYTRWFDARALLVGWFAGVVAGTWMAAALAFKSSVYPLHLFGVTVPGYAAVYSLVLNLAAAVVLTILLRAAGAARAADETTALDYV